MAAGKTASRQEDARQEDRLQGSRLQDRGQNGAESGSGTRSGCALSLGLGRINAAASFLDTNSVEQRDSQSSVGSMVNTTCEGSTGVSCPRRRPGGSTDSGRALQQVRAAPSVVAERMVWAKAFRGECLPCRLTDLCRDRTARRWHAEAELARRGHWRADVHLWYHVVGGGSVCRVEIVLEAAGPGIEPHMYSVRSCRRHRPARWSEGVRCQHPPMAQGGPASSSTHAAVPTSSTLSRCRRSTALLAARTSSGSCARAALLVEQAG